MRNVRKSTIWVSLWEDSETRCLIILIALCFLTLLFWMCKRCGYATSPHRTFPSKKPPKPRTYRLHYPGYTVFCRETRSMTHHHGGEQFGIVRQLLGQLFGSRIVDIPGNAVSVSIPTKRFRSGKRPDSFVPNGAFRKVPKYSRQVWTESVQAVCLRGSEELVGVCIWLCGEQRETDVELIVSRMRDLVVKCGREWRPPLVSPLAFYNYGRGDGTVLYRYPHRNTISGLMSRIQQPSRRAGFFGHVPPLRRPPEELPVLPAARRDTPSPSGSDPEAPPDYETLWEEDYGVSPPQYWTIRNETNYWKFM